MKIKTFSLHPYETPLTTGQIRQGIFINIIDDEGNSGWGEIAPLPKWSYETLNDSLQQLKEKQQEIMKVNWTASNCLKQIGKLNLLPSLSFGLESALLSILIPLPEYSVSSSALLMGSPKEIMHQAEERHKEGYVSAKLKVSNLNFDEASQIIHHLKNKFHLRIDVNRAWKTSESLQFFKQFPLNTFDYVEEPFQNPHDLVQFPHPLAVDESFSKDLTLEHLESFPTLKALIYKPTMQGGLQGCLQLSEWAKKRGITIVLSSSFETDFGLGLVASIAYRLALLSPVGIGTFNFLDESICTPPLHFFNSFVRVPAGIKPLI